MKKTPALVLVVMTLLAGCGSSKEKTAQTVPDENLLSGTVAYRERMAIPADATVDVWIMDATPGMVAQVILAETSIVTDGRQVPIAFTIQYDLERVEAEHDYAVKAVIRSGGETLFETIDGTPVLTKGHPKHVDLMLTKSGGVPADSTAAPQGQ